MWRGDLFLCCSWLSQDRLRNFVSHWKRGYPTDVTLVCEVVGIDPTYGFPRICDATANVQIFQKEMAKEMVTQAYRTESMEQEGGGKIVVELKGKCFNASLTIEKHEQRCPWCQEEQDQQLAYVAQPEFEISNSSSVMNYFGGGEQLLCVAVTVLAGIAIISTAAFACLLIAFIKQKRNSPTKCRVGSFPSSGMHIDPIHLGEDCRYEMPWDQKYRPIPPWMSNRDELITSSPNHGSSPSSGPLFYQSSRTTIGGITRYESPTTSISGRHDDSGLESV
ncbi:unnamed protein product [Enterobius vermicularis]|uniref:Ephrin_rec_like domain-containing protein n=1 Tax=Enterobius vermicularis TaxID=51028 RepID=A0A0N4VC18_ENTVE|nr:unnamed protein product [Enterobius vermicularis]